MEYCWEKIVQKLFALKELQKSVAENDISVGLKSFYKALYMGIILIKVMDFHCLIVMECFSLELSCDFFSCFYNANKKWVGPIQSIRTSE